MKERLKALLEQMWAGFKALPTQIKAAIVFVGSVLLIAKFRDLLISILASSARRILDAARKKDASLANKENAANQAANEHLNKANSLANTKPEVDEDWHKK